MKQKTLEELRRDVVSRDRKTKKEIFDILNKNKIELYNGKPEFRKDGEPTHIILFQNIDKKEFYCIIQCTHCYGVSFCRNCKTQAESCLHTQINTSDIPNIKHISFKISDIEENLFKNYRYIT